MFVGSRLLHGVNVGRSGSEDVFLWRGASLAATFGCSAAQTGDPTRFPPSREVLKRRQMKEVHFASLCPPA